MNRLAPAPSDEREGAGAESVGDRYFLPAHAHLVVYERDDGGSERDDGIERDDGGNECDDGGSERDDGDGREQDAGTGEDSAARSAGASSGGSRGLITIYDCGAAQKPPSAQLLGVLGSVRAACETTRNPTGYVVRMREPSVLVDVGDGRYVVRER